MSDKIKEIRDEGHRLGEARAQENNAEEMLPDGSLFVQKIAKFSGLSAENVRKMKRSLENHNL